ncbi:TonB-dependent receptor family protein [Mucilaginibacter sp. UR6-1]|uniref:outer membrane beta-barrel family protein n=1 Tax=Mucilaginibacter sp. UR6-1 TaxID=1435643 RepID=UPI001E3E287F|nr:outer membrane beta-barrel family protein [Mucilaginibacter sp. UR6-1]MCC8409734.1 TonB-dependent receptor family protein [Mucilaginibacter sp. UR6-1]
MNILTRSFLLILFAFACTQSLAQTGLKGIEGKVLTEVMQPADAATVRLLHHPDSLLIATTISDKNGFFEFRDIKPGKYFIAINKLGYNKFYTLQYVVAEGSGNIKTPDVKLVPLNYQLKEVKVTAKKEFVEVRPDKTIINVEKSIVSAGNNMLDVLKNAPGVKVSGEEVLFKGGQKALIAINGKVTQLTGEQLAELLKSYNSSMVSSVELIGNPSAKYDAAGGGLINIVLKKNRDLGWRVSTTQSAAVGENYKFNSGINLNYRAKKVNLFGSYIFTASEVPRFWDVDRLITIGPNTSDYKMRYKGTTRLKSYTFNTGADWAVSPKQNIGFILHGYATPADIDKRNTTNIAYNGVPDSVITTRSGISRNIYNLNYNLNYRGFFGKDNKHVLSADMDYSDYNRRSDEELRNDFFNPAGVQVRDPLFYRVISPADINIYSAKIDYTRVLSSSGSVDAGVKVSKVNSDNRIDFNEQVDGNFQLVPGLTDHFVYKERIEAGYVNYHTKIGATDITAGLRAEQTHANRTSYNPNRVADTSYFNLFPSIQLIRGVGEKHQFTLSYNRRISRPNYQDLNPFVAYIDPYAFSTGNPFLKPQYVNYFELADTYLIKFKAALSFTATNDFYTTIYEQNNATGVYTTTKSNVANRHVYGLEITAPFDVTPWWQINSYFEFSHSRYFYKDENAGNKHAYDFLTQINQSFSITDKFKAEVNANYETPTYFGIKNYREQYYFSAGMSHIILHDQGTIRLAMSDIFNTQIDRYDTRYLNLNMRGREKPGTRFVTVTFNYRFGNSTLKAARKRTGGAAEELSRMGGSSNEN